MTYTVISVIGLDCLWGGEDCKPVEATVLPNCSYYLHPGSGCAHSKTRWNNLLGGGVGGVHQAKPWARQKFLTERSARPARKACAPGNAFRECMSFCTGLCRFSDAPRLHNRQARALIFPSRCRPSLSLCGWVGELGLVENIAWLLFIPATGTDSKSNVCFHIVLQS